MANKDTRELHQIENAEWRESLDYVLKEQGEKRVVQILRLLQTRAQEHGVSIPFTANTPYINTIPPKDQPVFPGNRALERRIKSIIRWNAAGIAPCCFSCSSVRTNSLRSFKKAITGCAGSKLAM